MSTTTADVAQAQRAVDALRKQIAKFQRIRTKNNEVITGMAKGAMAQEQAKQVALRWRDPAMEAHAVECLRKTLELLKPDAPAVDAANPLPAGVEASLGWLPWVAGGVIALAGAAYSAFQYATAREERVLEETRGPVASFAHQLSENTWALAALGLVVIGGVIYWDTRLRASLGGE